MFIQFRALFCCVSASFLLGYGGNAAAHGEDHHGYTGGASTHESEIAARSHRELRDAEASARLDGRLHRLASVGHDYYRAGHWEDADRVFLEIEAETTDARLKSDALRMQARASQGRGEYSESIARYERFVDFVYSADISTSESLLLLRQGYEAIAELSIAQRNFERAVEYRQKMLEDLELTGDYRAIVLKELARAQLRQGDRVAAVSSFDRLFSEMPDYGRGNGRIVNLKLEQLAARGQLPNDPEKLRASLAIWDGLSSEGYPQVLNAGRLSVALADFQNNREVLERVSVEFLELARQLYPQVQTGGLDEFAIDDWWAQVAITWGQALHGQGRFIEALAVYAEFVNSFPDHQFAEQVRQSIAHIQEAELGFSEQDSIDYAVHVNGLSPEL